MLFCKTDQKKRERNNCKYILPNAVDTTQIPDSYIRHVIG